MTVVLTAPDPADVGNLSGSSGLLQTMQDCTEGVQRQFGRLRQMFQAEISAADSETGPAILQLTEVLPLRVEVAPAAPFRDCFPQTEFWFETAFIRQVRAALVEDDIESQESGEGLTSTARGRDTLFGLAALIEPKVSTAAEVLYSAYVRDDGCTNLTLQLKKVARRLSLTVSRDGDWIHAISVNEDGTASERETLASDHQAVEQLLRWFLESTAPY